MLTSKENFSKKSIKEKLIEWFKLIYNHYFVESDKPENIFVPKLDLNSENMILSKIDLSNKNRTLSEINLNSDESFIPKFENIINLESSFDNVSNSSIPFSSEISDKAMLSKPVEHKFPPLLKR